MKTLFMASLLVLGLSSCTKNNETNDSPKSKVSDLSEPQILKEADEDMSAVVQGKKPLHAILDEKHPLPADGGTTYYVGTDYKLEIKKTISDDGEGFMYGPIITFDKIVENGKSKQISNIKFYKNEDLRKLLGN